MAASTRALEAAIKAIGRCNPLHDVEGTLAAAASSLALVEAALCGTPPPADLAAASSPGRRVRFEGAGDDTPASLQAELESTACDAVIAVCKKLCRAPAAVDAWLQAASPAASCSGLFTGEDEDAEDEDEDEEEEEGTVASPTGSLLRGAALQSLVGAPAAAEASARLASLLPLLDARVSAMLAEPSSLRFASVRAWQAADASVGLAVAAFWAALAATELRAPAPEGSPSPAAVLARVCKLSAALSRSAAMHLPGSSDTLTSLVHVVGMCCRAWERVGGRDGALQRQLLVDVKAAAEGVASLTAAWSAAVAAAAKKGGSREDDEEDDEDEEGDAPRLRFVVAGVSPKAARNVAGEVNDAVTACVASAVYVAASAALAGVDASAPGLDVLGAIHATLVGGEEGSSGSSEGVAVDAAALVPLPASLPIRTLATLVRQSPVVLSHLIAGLCAACIDAAVPSPAVPLRSALRGLWPLLLTALRQSPRYSKPMRLQITRAAERILLAIAALAAKQASSGAGEGASEAWLAVADVLDLHGSIVPLLWAVSDLGTDGVASAAGRCQGTAKLLAAPLREGVVPTPRQTRSLRQVVSTVASESSAGRAVLTDTREAAEERSPDVEEVLCAIDGLAAAFEAHAALLAAAGAARGTAAASPDALSLRSRLAGMVLDGYAYLRLADVEGLTGEPGAGGGSGAGSGAGAAGAEGDEDDEDEEDEEDDDEDDEREDADALAATTMHAAVTLQRLLPVLLPKEGGAVEPGATRDAFATAFPALLVMLQGCLYSGNGPRFEDDAVLDAVAGGLLEAARHAPAASA